MSGVHLPPSGPPSDEAAELREKLEHARVELSYAHDVLVRLRGGVADMRAAEPPLPVPSWVPDLVERTEIPAAEARVQLWQDVVDELLRRLAAL